MSSTMTRIETAMGDHYTFIWFQLMLFYHKNTFTNIITAIQWTVSHRLVCDYESMICCSWYSLTIYGTNHLSLFFNLVLLMGIEWKQRLIQCQNKLYVFCLVICTVKCGWFSTKWVSIPTLRTLKCRHLFQVAQDWKTYFSMWNTWREN